MCIRDSIYRPDEVVQEVENPVVLSAAPVLHGFKLNADEIRLLILSLLVDA